MMLQIVDLVNNYDFAIVLHSNAVDGLTCGIQHLLDIMRIPPRMIDYNDNTSIVCNFSEECTDIIFVSQPHTALMKLEWSLKATL